MSNMRRGWGASDPVRTYIPLNLWMKAGENKEIAILEKEPIKIPQHLYSDPRTGKFNIAMACIAGSGRVCPGCEIEDVFLKKGVRLECKRHVMSYFTIFDYSPYFDKKKEEERLSGKKLLAMKPLSASLLEKKEEILSKIAENKGETFTMKDAKFIVSRSTDKVASCGDVFEYVSHIDIKELSNQNEGYDGKALDLSPYDYESIFEELPVFEMKHILNIVSGEDFFGIDENSSNVDLANASEEEIPF